MVIENKFNFGDIVYLKTDKEQSARMVCRMSVKPSEIQYCLSCGSSETWHLDIEISTEVNELMKVT